MEDNDTGSEGNYNDENVIYNMIVSLSVCTFLTKSLKINRCEVAAVGVKILLMNSPPDNDNDHDDKPQSERVHRALPRNQVPVGTNLILEIKASEMLTAPTISKCFGLPWSALDAAS